LGKKRISQRGVSKKKTELTIAGEGIAEEWVYGWTFGKLKNTLIDLRPRVS